MHVARFLALLATNTRGIPAGAVPHIEGLEAHTPADDSDLGRTTFLGWRLRRPIAYVRPKMLLFRGLRLECLFWRACTRYIANVRLCPRTHAVRCSSCVRSCHAPARCTQLSRGRHRALVRPSQDLIPVWHEVLFFLVACLCSGGRLRLSLCRQVAVRRPQTSTLPSWFLIKSRDLEGVAERRHSSAACRLIYEAMIGSEKSCSSYGSMFVSRSVLADGRGAEGGTRVVQMGILQ